MEDDVVHAGYEHQVEVGLALRQGCTEVLGEPSEGLARCEAFAGNVSRGRRIFEHGEVGVILLGESGIPAKTANAEIAQSEALTFWNIDGSIDIEQVGWTTVSLVESLGAMSVSPLGPLSGEVLQKQVAESFAVVADNQAISIGAQGVGLGEDVDERLEVVATSGLKFFKEPGCQVGSVHLV